MIAVVTVGVRLAVSFSLATVRGEQGGGNGSAEQERLNIVVTPLLGFGFGRGPGALHSLPRAAGLAGDGGVGCPPGNPH